MQFGENHDHNQKPESWASRHTVALFLSIPGAIIALGFIILVIFAPGESNQPTYKTRGTFKVLSLRSVGSPVNQNSEYKLRNALSNLVPDNVRSHGLIREARINDTPAIIATGDNKVCLAVFFKNSQLAGCEPSNKARNYSTPIILPGTIINKKWVTYTLLPDQIHTITVKTGNQIYTTKPDHNIAEITAKPGSPTTITWKTSTTKTRYSTTLPTTSETKGLNINTSTRHTISH